MFDQRGVFDKYLWYYFFLNIERTISLLDINEIVASFNIEIPEDLKVVAYKSENRITNIGNESWSKKQD